MHAGFFLSLPSSRLLLLSFYRTRPLTLFFLKRVHRSPTGRTSIVCAWASRLLQFSWVFTGTFILSHNLITWCPASFRPSTHIRSMTTLGHPSLFSFSIVWRFGCVCVLNFYDFIIPYFKPFVRCYYCCWCCCCCYNWSPSPSSSSFSFSLSSSL